jgi:ABC-type transport system substrate-binding protein
MAARPANPVFATSYISFDLKSPPFDNVDVRRAFYYAVNRDELTKTVLKDIAIPAGSILPDGYPGHSENITKQAVFDPAKAKELMAKAGYPDGKGFPEVEVWFREEGGYNGAILPPMAQYLQAQFKEILGITMNIKVMPGKDWMEGMLARKNNLYIAPYEYDYLDPSNFYGIFYNGGRHSYHVPEYDKLVAEADSNPNWDERVKLYEQAEQVMIDQGLIVPLVHPIIMAVVSEDITGPGVTPNSKGFTPLDRIGNFLYSHINVK